MTAKKKFDFQVNYRVHAVIGINVVAADEAEAKQKAADALGKKQLFSDGIEYCDGTYIYCGNTNNSMWRSLP